MNMKFYTNIQLSDNYDDMLEPLYHGLLAMNGKLQCISTASLKFKSVGTYIISWLGKYLPK